MFSNRLFFISMALTPIFAQTQASQALAQAIPLNYAATGSEPAFITAVPANVCAGTQYYDENGNLQTGTKTCGGPANCTTDGQGTCLVDGTNFRAAQMSAFTAANIKSGVTLAGVTGTTAVTPANCSSDGQLGCTATSSFSAADMSLAIAGNIKSGIVIAGVNGGYPSAAQKMVDNSGSTDLSSLAANVAAGVYEWWKSDGTKVTGSISDAGTITIGTTNQTFNTSIYRQFTVPGDSSLTAANIKSGVAIFGVTGAYPSATYPLPGASGTADIDSATFNAKIKSSSTFEWWDSVGARHSSSGSTDITAANIQSGVAIFGTTGTYGDNCSSDGEIDCLTTSNYPSLDTASFSALDLRSGKNAGGIAGGIVFHKNMADTGLYDRTTGTAAVTGLDIFDTIDDSANGGSFPTQNPAGWSQATGANWQRDAASDDGSGGGTSADGICNGTEDCVYRDLLTGHWWSKAYNTISNWESAITYCDSLTSGTYSDWRMPTEKELLQAHIDGIWSLKASSKLNVTTSKYWSATTYSMSTTMRYYVGLENGSVTFTGVASGVYTICVRP